MPSTQQGIFMKSDPPKPVQDLQLMLLVSVLEEMRNSLVMISLAMNDMLSETPSQAREDVLAEAGRYLERVRSDSKNGLA
jgi:hypothetical protein